MLETIVDGVYGASDWLRMTPGWWFPLRMTILKLDSGELALHSPIRPTPELIAAVKGLGSVAYIIAPNCFHHLFAGRWKEAFPEAALVAAAGLRAKRPDLAIDLDLTTETPEAWAGQIDCQEIRGIPGLREVVFLHRPSRTLIVTDLIFNIKESRGVLTPLMLMITGCRNKTAQSRLVRFSTKDRRAAGESMREVLAWDFDHIVMAHGEVIHGEGKEVLTEACRWMLEGAALPAPAP